MTTPAPTYIPIKASTCPSLTGTTTISYKIAINTSSTFPFNTNNSVDISSVIYFQILKNSNTGKFSEKWIAYNDAKSAFPIGSFSSAPLRTLYRNKSLNTPGFLLAALLNEGVVEREPGKRLMFRFQSDEEFLAVMQKLVDAEIDVTDAVKGDKSSGRRSKKSPRVKGIENGTCKGAA